MEVLAVHRDTPCLKWLSPRQLGQGIQQLYGSVWSSRLRGEREGVRECDLLGSEHIATASFGNQIRRAMCGGLCMQIMAVLVFSIACSHLHGQEAC